MQVKNFFDSIFSLSLIPDYSWIKAIRQRKLRINLHSATKLVETLLYKGAFCCFTDFKRGKLIFSSPIPSMQCCAAVRATYRKQQTPQLWMEGRGRGVDSFVLWSYPVWAQCLNNFVANNIVGVRKFNLHLILTCNMYIGRCIIMVLCV